MADPIYKVVEVVGTFVGRQHQPTGGLVLPRRFSRPWAGRNSVADRSAVSEGLHRLATRRAGTTSTSWPAAED
jgi:hypothetical protein